MHPLKYTYGTHQIHVCAFQSHPVVCQLHFITAFKGVLAMKLIHRGFTLDLPDEDPRVAVIEALLFGKTLPAPLPVPAVEQPAPPPPAVNIPPALSRFWSRLDEVQRQELVLLCGHRYKPDDLEAALDISQRQLSGNHSSINRLAHNFGVAVQVRASGRSRHSRKYWMDEDSIRLVRLLVRAP
jgi:hypothetical protein